jgi:hypothetical protein
VSTNNDAVNASDRSYFVFMRRARQIARSGTCIGWTEVVEQMRREGRSVRTLQSCVEQQARAQIDLLCKLATCAKPEGGGLLGRPCLK